jgi:guanylate kinase
MGVPRRNFQYKKSNREKMKRGTMFFLVGNFGVGKSSIVKNEVIAEVDEILLKIKNNLYVAGKKIIGADSLSSVGGKAVVREVLNRHPDKNIILTGVYYYQLVDLKAFYKNFNIVVIYLKTSFEQNNIRVAKRGRVINIDTYNAKLKSHQSFLKSSAKYGKVIFLDNNRPLEEVRNDFYNIIKKETEV